MHDLLWTPSKERAESTEMYAFMQYVNTQKKLALENYNELYRFSVEKAEEFWDLLWKYLGIISTPYTKVVDDTHKMPGARWFIGAKLNYAENMLRFCRTDVFKFKLLEGIDVFASDPK